MTGQRDAMEAWGAESGHIEVTVRDAVAVVTLGRPDRLNALTAGMRRELAAILRHFGDGELSRGIVVTGAGRAFSAGLGLRGAAKLPPGGLIADVGLVHDITRAALQTRAAVGGALHGGSVGGAAPGGAPRGARGVAGPPGARGGAAEARGDGGGRGPGAPPPGGRGNQRFPPPPRGQALTVLP